MGLKGFNTWGTFYFNHGLLWTQLTGPWGTRPNDYERKRNLFDLVSTFPRAWGRTWFFPSPTIFGLGLVFLGQFLGVLERAFFRGLFKTPRRQPPNFSTGRGPLVQLFFRDIWDILGEVFWGTTALGLLSTFQCAFDLSANFWGSFL